MNQDQLGGSKKFGTTPKLKLSCWKKLTKKEEKKNDNTW